MSWRLARAIRALIDEVDVAVPGRSKASDGTIGDAAHASRTSDHNPWVVDGRGEGVVTAVDLTDDDASGADMAKLVDFFARVSHDKRIKYLIHNRRIYSSYPTSSAPAWAARPYSGINAHVHHLHVSVSSLPAMYDDASQWGVAEALGTDPAPGPHAPPPAGANVRSHPRFPLRSGSYFGPRYPLSDARSVSGYYGHSGDLKVWQAQLRRRGWKLSVDGHYGPQTEAVARAFQREKHLHVDGLIGPTTWDAAWTAPVTK